MYTSGTTGDPKGVMISNKSIISLIAGVQRLLESVNEEVVCHSLLVLTRFYLWKPGNEHLTNIYYGTVNLDGCILNLSSNSILTFVSISHTVECKRCIFVIPSTSTYLWPGDRRVVYLTWCFHWVLAWGEQSFDFLGAPNIRFVKVAHHFHSAGC